jgi:hypothetical protein
VSSGANGGSGGEAMGGAPTGYAGVVLADGPLGYWRLNEGSFPDVFDSSGNAHQGLINGNVQLQVGGALSGDFAMRFEGGGWIDFGDVLDFPMKQEFTLEAWIQPDAASPDGGIVGKADYDSGLGGYAGYIWVVHNGKLRLHRTAYAMGSDTCDSDALIATDSFTYVVTTYDGITVRHYLNGLPENTGAGAAEMPDLTQSLLIGYVNNWGDFTGVIDEVAIYDYALSPPQITAHYRAAMNR